MKREKALRIALVVEVFDASKGGVERAVWELARAFVEMGDDVHVIAREGQEQPGVRLHRVPVPDSWQPLRVWLFSRTAARVIASESFDVVHGFSRTQSQDVFHAGGGSHLAYLKNNYSKMGAAIRRLSPRHRLQMHLERRIVRDPRQRIQCVSEMVRREFLEYYSIDPRRLFVVPYGVDLEQFRPDQTTPTRIQLRNQWGGDPGTTWLFPGSNFRRKGLGTALKALALSQDREAKLWVAGRDRPDRWQKQAAQLGLRDRVYFLGPRKNMEELYAAADGVLLPTRYDAGALVGLETAASARPFVTSAHCGPAELLAEAGAVIQVAEDASAFAAVLDRFADADERARAGRRGRAIAEQHSWRKCAEDLRTVYKEINVSE